MIVTSFKPEITQITIYNQGTRNSLSQDMINNDFLVKQDTINNDLSEALSG